MLLSVGSKNKRKNLKRGWSPLLFGRRVAKRGGGFPATTHIGRGPGRHRRGCRRSADARPAVPLLGWRPIRAEREASAREGSHGQGFGTTTPGDRYQRGHPRRTPVTRWWVEWVAKERGSGRAREWTKPTPSQPKSNPETGPLAWIRGGFPLSPIYFEFWWQFIDYSSFRLNWKLYRKLNDA